MLDFFRKYQRYFFLVITVVVIFSFVFFGTYSTFLGDTEEKKDCAVGHRIDGAVMMLSEVQELSRLIAADRSDSTPNFCNDGVIRKDFLKDRLADLLVAEYFDALKEDFALRLDRAKRFSPYAHPEAPFLSAKAVWDRFVPEVNQEITALQAENEVTPALFPRFVKLYQLQSLLHPDVLRRILIHQHQQYPWLTVDQRLSYEDLAIFGFHSTSDWFGRHFIDLVAEFILNAAVVAEEKGYRVSLEEAKGDLIHHFQESMQKLAEAKTPSDLNFHQHLQMFGFDEKSAAESWRKVLLFRRYFHDIGETSFVDRLPYRDFSGYANEAVLIQAYRWPIQIQDQQELAELQFYLNAVCPKGKDIVPTSFYPVEEVAKNFPQLVQSKYRAKIAEVSKKEVGLRASISQVWEWQVEEKNWPKLQAQFSLPPAAAKEQRFEILRKREQGLRAQIDAWSRGHLVDENPLWMEEALAASPLQEKTWMVSANENSTPRHAEGIFIRVENLEQIEEKRILSFDQAREVLAKLVPDHKNFQRNLRPDFSVQQSAEQGGNLHQVVESEREAGQEKMGQIPKNFCGRVLVHSAEGEYSHEKNPFLSAAKEALAALQKNPADPRWIQSGADPLLDSFKFMRSEQMILRNSQEDWMKEQAFMMAPHFWSPIHVADDGEIIFFYLQEKQASRVPILDQLSLGKETLAADAKAYVAERLLQTVKKKQAIVIPVQKKEAEE